MASGLDGGGWPGSAVPGGHGVVAGRPQVVADGSDPAGCAGVVGPRDVVDAAVAARGRSARRAGASCVRT